MSEYSAIISVLGTLAGGVLVFFASNYLQEQKRKHETESEYRRELRKYIDGLIKPLFSLIQDFWLTLTVVQSHRLGESNRVSEDTKQIWLRRASMQHEKLQDFVDENYETLSLILQSPFPWVFKRISELVFEGILIPLLTPELDDLNEDPDPDNDIATVLITLERMQEDLRRLIGFDINIKMETKFPFE